MLRILSLSHYGADLARGSVYSGALDRQKEYARETRSYVIIVPGHADSLRFRDGPLCIIPTAHNNTVLFLWDAFWCASALHREEPFDAVMVDNPHLMGLFGLVLRWKLAVPLIVHSMADMPWNPWYDRERLINRIKQLVMRFVVRHADLVRVSTDTEVARLRAHGIPNTKIVCVPFYIDQEAFVRSIGNSTLEREPHHMIYVGRLGLQKDVGTLVRAVAVVRKRVPDTTLTIIGGGPEREHLETLANALGVSSAIEFAGAVPRERIANEFKRAAVCVLPSLYEGTCMVLHEAALADLPIVSTENAGARDFIRDGEEGYLVRVRDHRGLGDRSAQLLLDSSLRDRMGSASRARAHAFSRERALQKWQELLARIALVPRV